MKKEPIAIPADPDDPDDFDVTAAALARGDLSRRIRMARAALGLSQSEFAERYRIPVGTLRDWEQARTVPPPYVMAYFRAIQQEPVLMAAAASAA